VIELAICKQVTPLRRHRPPAKAINLEFVQSFAAAIEQAATPAGSRALVLAAEGNFRLGLTAVDPGIPFSAGLLAVVRRGRGATAHASDLKRARIRHASSGR